jgi:hypothetical protein
MTFQEKIGFLKAKTDETEITVRSKLSENLSGLNDFMMDYRLLQYFGYVEEPFLSAVQCTCGY